jgi:hypothetical protein
MCCRPNDDHPNIIPIMATDCTLQPIQRPTHDESAWYCKRKAIHCVKHWSVVDWRGFTTMLRTNFSGRESDANTYRRSDLFNSWSTHMSPHETILADSGFPGCALHYVLPKPAHGSLTPAQQQENSRIRRHRVIIEFSYGFVKYKWAVLRKKWQWHPKEKAGWAYRLGTQLCNRIMHSRQCYLRSSAYYGTKQLERWEAMLQEQVPVWEGDVVQQVLEGAGAERMYRTLPRHLGER